MITFDAVSQFTYIASAAENYFQKLPFFINKVTLESAVQNKNYGQIWIKRNAKDRKPICGLNFWSRIYYNRNKKSLYF